ncbi:hypothetical protein [Leifsonia sp. WHRI 6310E]|uniref:hypothetical protein n=1 Tax=Leifsonia sp. WHRI 6310E TaxID=3162562 RepID=UPI0032ED9AAC
MSRGTSSPVEIGGVPRVDLLPPEVRFREASRRLRRRLALIVAACIVTALAATGATGAAAVQAQARLEATRSDLAATMAQQLKYSKVRGVQQQLALIESAQEVGASTEIDWAGYVDRISAAMPAGMQLLTISTVSASPSTPVTQASVPLQPARVATITMTATSSSLLDIPDWLDALGGLAGFVDATAGSVTKDNSGLYTVNVTMHVGAEAYSGRFERTGK